MSSVNNIKTMMAVVLCAVAARAAEPALQGAADVPALVGELKAQAGSRALVQALRQELPPSYWEEGCATVTFDSNSGPLSEPVKLESVQYQEFCRGAAPDGSPNCWTDRVRVENRTLRIRVEGRGPLRGREKEVFKACLMETALQASLVKGARGYDFIMPKRLSDPIVARAKKDGLF